MSTEPLPPHLQRFAHPLGETVWAAIKTLDVGTKEWLLEKLEEHLAESLLSRDRPGRQQRAVRALRRAKRLLGHTPSVNEYRRLREETDDPELIADSSIRGSLASGSWNDVLALAGLPRLEEDVRVAVRATKSPLRYTEAECFAALRECAHDIGMVPSETMYTMWARRGDVRRRPGRRPASVFPFARRFRSFARAVQASGVPSGDVRLGRTDDVSLCAAKFGYTDSDFFSALREVSDRCGGVPRSTEYMRAREEIARESTDRGKPRIIPGYGAFLKRFGSWNDALVAAGMRPYESRWELTPFVPPGTGSVTWDHEELLAIVREGCDACRGQETTMDEYLAWRREELRRTEQLGASRRIPSRPTIFKHFGGWVRIKQRLFPEE